MAKSKMKLTAEQYGKPLRQVLIDLFEKHGSIRPVAKELGVQQSTVSYWLLRERLELVSRAVESERT
jgi:hypothetical protein